MSDFGLAQRLEIGRAEAKEITTAYFARFPDVRAYIDRTIEDGRRNGLRLDDCGPAALHAGVDVR
jgi:DNA polymerase-1